MAKYFVVTSVDHTYSSSVGEVGVVHRETTVPGEYEFIDGVRSPLLQYNRSKTGIEEVSSLDDLIRTNEELSIW